MKDNNPGEKSTKEQIMYAAIDLFSQKGYDAVSIREIARAVGIRESSIYNHYKGKEDLMESIIEFFLTELSKPDTGDASMEALLEKYGPEKYMVIAGKAYMERFRDVHLEKVWRLISVELYRNKKVREFFKTTMVGYALSAWEQTFRKMIELGYIREYDPRILAKEFFNYCVYLYFEYFFLRYDEMSFQEFIDSVMNDLDDHIKFMFEALKIKEAA